MSSHRVTLLSDLTSLPPLTASHHHPVTDGSEGFTLSEWAGERLLENVARTTGLEVVVHRPCAAMGPAASNSDALDTVVAFSLLLRPVLRFHNCGGFFDCNGIGQVAREVGQQALHQTPGEAGVGQLVIGSGAGDVASLTVVHYSSGIKTPMGQLR